MRALLFDFDGVIVESEDTYWRSFNRLLEPLGIRISREEWYARFPGTGARHILDTVLQGHSPNLDMQPWLEKWKKVYQALVREEGVKPVRGFLDFNSQLNARGIKKAICTGSPRENVLLQLRRLGIEKEFPLVAHEDIAQRKPHPEGFLKAAALIWEAPGNCIVFEDTPPGIQAAKAGGMKCIALATALPRARLEGERPDMIVQDYTGLDIDMVLSL